MQFDLTIPCQDIRKATARLQSCHSGDKLWTDPAHSLRGITGLWFWQATLPLKRWPAIRENPMRNLLLSIALIAVPVGVCTVGFRYLAPPAAEAAVQAGLGDLSSYAAIVTDVADVAKTGDLAAAKTRIKDLETAWDDSATALRAVNPTLWGNVDGAIDDALSALRAGSPDAATVTSTLTALQAAIADPTLGSAAPSGSIATVGGVAITDANGRPLPCEEMLKTFRKALGAATLSDADRATAATFEAKGTERCNADDDARADDFLAQGIARIKK